MRQLVLILFFLNTCSLAKDQWTVKASHIVLATLNKTYTTTTTSEPLPINKTGYGVWRDVFQDSTACRAQRPGDCDPVACGGTCEARYIRFYDRAISGDRTIKSCQCAQEKICSIIGMHAYAGCRSYITLSAAAQKLIRTWSMDARDRKNRFSNDIRKRYSDKMRHQQLIYANSRFCCRSKTQKFHARALRLKSPSLASSLLAAFSVAVYRIL